ncbi:MAG TPA: hypothetical protein ENK06_08625 [Gammaproteobacteria bacterium]|nr:hypothetical protein [Gammaproteobacteria bacterium]
MIDHSHSSSLPFFRLVLSLFLSSLLVSCGGGSGSSPEKINYSLELFVTKGPISSAQCELRNPVDDASVIAGPASTDTGYLKFENLSYKGTAAVICSGGSYVDETTGENIDASGLTLRTLVELTGANQEQTVSPFTEVSFRLAKNADIDDFKNQSELLADAFGMDGVDIRSVKATDVLTTVPDLNTDAGRYGVALAVLSQIIKDSVINPTAATSISQLLNQLETDMADGELNGYKPLVYSALINLANSGENAGLNLTAEIGETYAMQLGQGSANSDDSDGDGVSDMSDAFPNDPLEFADLDLDGIGNSADPDIDGDTITNVDDMFPLDPHESSDLDQDGIGDNKDTDRDGDTVLNVQDVFPDNPTEWADLDGDGVGDNADPDRDGDGVKNEDDAFPEDASFFKLPLVTIDSPKTLLTVGHSPIEVSGSVDSADVTLTINDVPVVITNATYKASVALEEGGNNIIARVVDKKNHEGTASISVSLDKTPPYITVQSPADGSTVYTRSIAVSGLINDIVRGTVSEGQANVEVNGVAASVVNRSYLAEGVLLQEGDNTITINASDAVGNSASKSFTVRYEVPSGKHIELVSGQNQLAKIRAVLLDELSVKLLDSGDKPVANSNVVFRVIQGDGIVGVGTGDEGQAILAVTDSDGIAGTKFKLGSRSGKGSHQVRAKAVGFAGEVIFYASADPQPGNKVSINSGNNQRAAVNQPLPDPFVVSVTDDGSNVIEGAEVEFKVTRGSGKFQNGENRYIATTDSDGRASAQLTLGGEEGFDVQRVSATLVGTEITAGFTASGLTPGDAGNTTITGVVFDNQDNPLPGVTVRVDGTTRQAVVDAQGQFTITEAPVGPVHLIADGSTASVAGEWPSLSYNIVTISGAENPLPAPIYMVKLNTENAVLAGEKDVEITLDEVPGFKLEVKAGSVTFPDGAKTGFISVTPVNSSKVPMAPPNGMQPQFIVTIQPTGTKFDPPAPLTLPNVDGHLPGAQVEMYSYDHDLEEFVAIGLGTVSADGATIKTNSGVGVIKAGWHCGSQPSGQGCANGCGVCQDCDGNCNCVNADNDPRLKTCQKCKDGKPEPVTPPDKCCSTGEAARIWATEPNTLGFTVCCNAKRVTCVTTQQLDANAKANVIVRKCVGVHEDTHHPHSKCPTGEKECEISDPPISGMTKGDAECAASKAEKKCYENSKASCGGDAACEARIAWWIQSAINYGNNNMPAGKTCF